MFDETSHENMESLLPIGAVPPLQEWDAQDERTRARFTQAFAGGIEAMAEAAG